MRGRKKLRPNGDTDVLSCKQTKANDVPLAVFVSTTFR